MVRVKREVSIIRDIEAEAETLEDARGILDDMQNEMVQSMDSISVLYEHVEPANPMGYRTCAEDA